MIEKIVEILAALAPSLGKLMSLIVSIFKKPLVKKEEEISNNNQSDKEHFSETGRPK